MKTITTLCILLTGMLSAHAAEFTLNGAWKLVFDDLNQGEIQEWYRPERFDSLRWQKIRVPSSWESYRTDYEGVAWYKREFELPASFAGKVVRLHFGASNYVTEVYLNGEPVGYHEGGYDPFEFRVDDLLKAGRNDLILRIVSPIVRNDSLTVDGMTRWEAPHWRGALVAGPWQSVTLIATQQSYFSDLFIQGGTDGCVKASFTINNTAFKSGKQRFRYTIHDRGTGQEIWHEEEERIVVPGATPITVTARITDPKLWSPDIPNLYRFEITDDKGNTVQTGFGLREFTVREDGFYLNGEKFYLKAGFWEGLYPNELAVPDSEEMLRKEILMAKQAGFNTLRPWRKPPVPLVLQMADELGICLIGCPALECMNEKPKVVPAATDRIFHEIESMIRRDRNHPSIILWELFNEVKRPGIGRLKHTASLRAREMDPTRPIIDESGGWSGGCRVYLPYTRESVPMNEIHSYQKAPVRESVYNLLRNMADGSAKTQGWSKLAPGAVSIISEVGYGGLPDLESNMSDFRIKGNPLTPTYISHDRLYTSMQRVMHEAGLDDLFGSLSALCHASQQVQAEGNERMLDALRMNPNLSGYCLHAYTDGDWVLGAGVLDIWRQPKKQYDILKRINSPVYVSAHTVPFNLYADDKIKIRLGAVSEKRSYDNAVLITHIITETGATIHSDSIQFALHCGVNPLPDRSLPIYPKVTGRCTLHASLQADGHELASGSSDFYVYPPIRRNSVKTATELVVFDPRNKLKPFLGRLGIPYRETLPAGARFTVLSTEDDLHDDASVELFREIFIRIKQGAKLVMLSPPLKKSNFHLVQPVKEIVKPTDNRFYTEKIFPFDLVERPAKGNWISNNHAIRKHPYFAGLPTGTFMGQTYANVAPDITIMGLDTRPIVCSVCWTIERNHMGIDKAYWGTDLAVVKYGRGEIVLSSLKLLPNIGSDPVADKILINILND